MASEFFLNKINSEDFKSNLNHILTELKDKKVVIYGTGAGFQYLRENGLLNDLNIVAIADKKFEDCTKKIPENYCNFKLISPKEIRNEVFDFILITNENSSRIISSLKNSITINISQKTKAMFAENFVDENKNYNYLVKMNFEKHLKRLKNKLKDKKIVIYGTGLLFQVIHKYFDLSSLNIIAVSDSKYSFQPKSECFDYKTVKRAEIRDLKPDYVLVATKFYVNLIDDLEQNLFKGTNIKVRPLIRKPFKTLFKEIWGLK